VRDSKQLSPAQRADIFERLMASDSIHVSFSSVDAGTIDEVNILQATLQAMQKAVLGLNLAPRYAIIDGNAVPKLPCSCVPVIRGDETEPSISAASIVAKVIRDRHMEEMDLLFPGYGFAQHKGYPTKAHFEAIRSLGVCPIHRRSFRGVCQIDQG
jgi:ribonuclease HII